MKALVLLVLAGCPDYASLSVRNAPGNVDLGQPLAHENGDPVRIEPPTDPGFTSVAVIAAPYVIGGAGRHYNPQSGNGEVGLEFRVERASGDFMKMDNWGVTVGMAFAQWSGDRTIAPGAFYGELDYRFLARGTYPLEFALGPLLYVDDSSPGAQLTFRSAFVMLRSRYVANSGFELMGGIEIPIPFFFGWSR